MVNVNTLVIQWIILQNIMFYFHYEVKKLLKWLHPLRYVFSFFGLRYLLQSDNGTEFVNSLIYETLKIWPGKGKIINGSPRKPWVQSCVERYNACVEEMISYRKEESKRNDWVSWLGQIQCK